MAGRNDGKCLTNSEAGVRSNVKWRVSDRVPHTVQVTSSTEHSLSPSACVSVRH